MELREDARLIQAKHHEMGAFGMTISNCNDAESQVRNVLWSFGGKVMAADGKTVVFNSPETRAAYQFIADMFLKDRTISRAALTWDDSGNNVAYQTKRSAFVINPPSIFQWMADNDKELLANSVMVSMPKGPGPHGQVGNIVGSWGVAGQQGRQACRSAKDWLRYFYAPDHYGAAVTRSVAVGRRSIPTDDTLPLFAANPAFKDFKKLASEGFLDGYAGPPNVLSGKVADATILTKVLQKVLVDHTPVDQAVAWGQQEIEKLAKGG